MGCGGWLDFGFGWGDGILGRDFRGGDLIACLGVECEVWDVVFGLWGVDVGCDCEAWTVRCDCEV